MNRFIHFVFLGSLVLIAGCKAKKSDSYQGYIEGEFVYVACPVPGMLTNLAVARGQEIKSNQLLFELEGESETAVLKEAQQRLTQAKHRLQNALKGRRPSEIASLEGQLSKAQANLQLSELELERRSRLIETKVISTEELDTVKARRDADLATIKTLKADIETAKLGAREDEIKAAEADISACEATVAKAQWAVTQKKQYAPADALVQDTLYRPGEFVPTGYPIVALLPPSNIKARFFVPQSELAAYKTGAKVQVRFDGSATPLTATINYVSPQAEFTPPVIYSQENRAKLVFKVEAVFPNEQARLARPGQPVDIKLAPAAN